MSESVPLVASGRVDALDGLRGLAALWVLLGHATMLTGWYLPIVGDPALGVDLFMMLSGFLMAFHHQARSRKVSPDAPGEWRTFWIRRFFRIAPLYYVALAAALAMGPMIYEARTTIDTFLNATPQLPERYLDSGLVNVSLHVSFLFGLLPDYAFRTPLPDWSLALEMQFYAAFPILMLLLRRLGWVPGILAIAAAGLAIGMSLGWLGIHFPMPTFLPLKLHVFACGMLLAASLVQPRRALLYLAFSCVLIAIPVGEGQLLRQVAVREALVIGFFALVLVERTGPLRSLLEPVARLLGTKPFHWLGELSFGSYLIHLLVMQPVAAWLIVRFGEEMAAMPRFLLVVAVVIPLTYGLSFVTYRLVEGPGQRLGARIVASLFRRPSPAPTGAAEQIPTQ